MQIDDFLKMMAAQDASDLHLKPMRPPMVRVKGKLVPLDSEILQPAVLRDVLSRILNEKQRRELEEKLYVEFGYSVAGLSRYRAAYFYQRGTVAAVFRRIPFQFPSLDQWELPETLKDLADLPQGLVLVVGASGVGKSSTLAAVIKEILDTRVVHVVTIEDPIEFLLTDNLGSVSQREVGTDTHSFADALRNTLRQDPDVIMVGEMRDTETVATVLSGAETGHLVLSTLHANSASQAIDRVIDCFPEGQHRQIRHQLSQVLQAVVGLELAQRADGSGMIAAVEILRKNPKVSKLIADGKMAELQEEIEKSVTYEKMQTMNQSLVALVLNGVITREEAFEKSPVPAEFTRELRSFLHHVSPAPADGENTMADSPADFSKILELREVRRLHEEAQEHMRQELAERDLHIEDLRAELAAIRDNPPPDMSTPIRALEEERDKLMHQLAHQKHDYEAKIEKLQNRIRELANSQAAPAQEAGWSGIFKR